jgi:hypothetical protein
MSCWRTASVIGGFAIPSPAVPMTAEAPRPPATRPAAPPALNPKKLTRKYALARPTAQNRTESRTCGRAPRAQSPKNLRAGLVAHCKKEQSEEGPLHRGRGRLDAELPNGHTSQNHAHDRTQLERPGNGMPDDKHEKKRNFRVVCNDAAGQDIVTASLWTDCRLFPSRRPDSSSPIPNARPP